MSNLCEFTMDLGSAGEFDFIVEYAYTPHMEPHRPGHHGVPESVRVEQITYGGVDWTKQLGKIIEKDENFLRACRDEWQDDMTEHQMTWRGCDD